MRECNFREAPAMTRRTVILLLALQTLIGFSVRAEDSSTNRLWRKVVMIGASASAGFTASEPLGGTNTVHHRLSRYVDAAIVIPHEPVLNLANSLFFLQPESSGKAQMARALKEQPSLLLAVDFPFWFCYGKGTNDTERFLRFEHGLKLLEPVTCPIVLGDIPDASAAVNKMLHPSQIPTAKAMAAANVRLKAWAATRPNVTLVPLSRLIQVASRNESYALHHTQLPAGSTRSLLQNDELHPTPAGAAVIALAMLDGLQQQQKFPDREVNWNPSALIESVRNSLRAGQAASSKPAGH